MAGYVFVESSVQQESVLDLPIVLKDGKVTALRIQLPPHFPTERPQLSVLVPVTSPYVDNTGRVHTQALNQWSFPSSRLVDVVREVAALLVGVPSENMRPGSLGAPVGVRPAAAQQTPPPPQPVVAPTGWEALTPGEVGQSVTKDLERLSVQELQDHLTDPEKFKQLAARIMSNTPAAQAVDALRAEVMEAAQMNLGRINEVNEARNQLAIVRSSEYAVARAQYDELAARQERVMQALAPDRLRSRLEEAVSKADFESEELRHQFQERLLGIEEFADKFVKSRAQYFMLDMKRQWADHVLPTA